MKIRTKTELAPSSQRILPVHLFACLLMALSLPTCAQPRDKEIITGAQQVQQIAYELKGKRVALLVNYTAMVGKTHLADTLKSLGTNLIKIFSPEHGFRGNADAGETVSSGVDAMTALKVVSLYGSHKKATAEDLADVDVVVYDIQDVGVRFYTYISSLHYMMEACAENNKKLIILDRPDPNGGYVDGPILEPEYKSFVGMHPIPVVYGMTVGEFAQMINGEKWLEGGKKCELKIVALKNYTHKTPYALPIKPSPNLPNGHTVALYPSTCFFEGTALSIGRGTQNPFEFVGSPLLTNMPFSFTPEDIKGMATNPPFEGKVCYGLDLRGEKVENKISLTHLIELYNAYPEKEKFFISYFEKLAGTKTLREQIIKGYSEQQIRDTWKPGLDAFQTKRKKYLLYE